MMNKIDDKSIVEVKYSSPKILLIDTSPDVEKALINRGFDVYVGSFGSTYRVTEANAVPKINDKLPFDWQDRWLVVVQFTPENPDEAPELKPLPQELAGWRMSPDEYGIINSRPIAMDLHRPGFDRIVKSGGIVICFTSSRQLIKLTRGSGTYQRVRELDNWGFLEILHNDHLSVEKAGGHEMSLLKARTPSGLGRLIQGHLEGANFQCVFGPRKRTPATLEFVPLVVDKYRRCVSAILSPKIQNDNVGFVLLLPQLSNKAVFLIKLVSEFLPDAVPGLFPELTSGRWLQLPQYELPAVLALKNKTQDIERDAQTEIDKIQKEIDQERETSGYMHDLLKETDVALVNAVEKTLRVLGFSNIINVDKEIEAGRESGRKREDLRIQEDQKLELLLEIKGISSLPSDEDCLSVDKYVAPRMKEKEDHRVKGLTVINHERHLPPLERQNATVFRGEIITSAEEREIGLMTTWDLFRLARSYLKNKWKHEQIAHLFYQSGRLDPAPNHYLLLGTIGKTFSRPPDTIIGIEIQQGEVALGNRIALELDNEFEEQIVDSLKIQDKKVKKATAGQQVGIKTHLDRNRLKKGMRVFKIS